ncbi:hypothetical protein SAMN05192561_101661 [Halopenitus malekzadehii]|uniref:4-carboxymuconolactone decarboxylase n=1 Tax=Halopenitus malekzadehii TaxID=1267564 RepID=A0A1H6I296_9EURY|nr:hypothetical protein [Halopenitus malekzadehii]SEH40604.1 hypothetical protein SAMN05192561_101661 [Halopenitus malekzadehii]
MGGPRTDRPRGGRERVDDRRRPRFGSGTVDELPAREACLVSYVRELIEEHAVSDSTFEAARDRYGETGITELTGTIGYYAMLACVLNAVEVVPDADRPQLP